MEITLIELYYSYLDLGHPAEDRAIPMKIITGDYLLIRYSASCRDYFFILLTEIPMLNLN